MADQNEDSIFSSIFNSLKRGGKNTLETDKSILINAPIASPFATKQQKQQDFLDIQSKKIHEDLYTRSMYYEADRFTSYQDYRAMDSSPEVSAALDILSDECVTKSEKGNILEIYSNNSRVKNTLKDLFYNVLNVNYNLGFWTRELLKFGDTFLKLEVNQDLGVYDVVMLPVGEIHRIENKSEELGTSKFKWDVNNLYFEEWQVAHFRLISDSNRLPYGRSVLEPARKLWRQLQLAEDAMLVYRLVRAPERRVYYIEVGNIDPADVPQYMEKAKASVKKTPMVDQKTGNINLKYAPMSYEEDFFLPVRGDKSSRIETLPGACLSLDTKIELLDGRSLELQEIIKEWDNGNTNLWSYSINPNTGEIVPGKITWAGITRKNTQVVKITLDNEKTIIVTPDHKFPTKFNGKKEAKDLQVGESLWSFNKKFKKILNKKKKTKEYEMIYDHNENDWVYTHRMVANYFKKLDEHNEYVFDIKNKDLEKNTIHHYNFLHTDNSPKNLYFMNFHDHVMLHQSMSMFYKEERKEGLIEYWNNISEEELIVKRKVAKINFQKGSDKLQELLKDEEYKKAFYEKTSATLKVVKNTPEYKSKQSKISSELWKDFTYRNSIAEKQTIKYSDNMLQFVVNKFKEGLSAEEILKYINVEYSLFMIEFNLLNEKNKQLKKMKNGFTHNNLDKMMKHFGYKNWRDFKSKVEFFNHKIISIEFLEEKQDTGTITIDGNELYHNFHNFALSCGVFTLNSNLGDIADIDYLQNKLFAALKVPKPYLNYAETIPGGSALAQADLRFSRTINRLQQFLVIELRRIANIHLHFLGFEDDINNFELTLANPSTQQELLKLETMKSRLEVFKELFTNEPTSPVSYTWAMQYIMGFSETEIKQILRQKKIERKMFAEIEGAADEYIETGIFNDLDRKFRKPGFVPGQTPAGGEGGADAGLDAGGGGSSFGGMSGGLGGDLGGGAGGLGGGDFGADAGTGEDLGADAGDDVNSDVVTDEEPLAENIKPKNKLQKNNAAVNQRTKMLMESIEKHLKSLDDGIKKNDDLIQG